ELGLRDLWAWYHWDFEKPAREPEFHRDIEPRAEYLTRGIAEGPPAFPQPVFADAREVFHGKIFALYRFPHVLPYAFTATRPAMEVREGLMRREEVTPVPAKYRDSDTIEVTAESREPAWLVLLVAHYPGWSVTVDGRPAVLRDADGYLAATLRPGTHRYGFAFRPVSFRVG